MICCFEDLTQKTSLSKFQDKVVILSLKLKAFCLLISTKATILFPAENIPQPLQEAVVAVSFFSPTIYPHKKNLYIRVMNFCKQENKKGFYLVNPVNDFFYLSLRITLLDT